MAKNREPEKPVESDTESGEEEDDEASSEEAGSQESDSEPDQTPITKKPSSSTPAAAKKPQSQASSKAQQQPRQPASSSDEEESGSESEPDSDGPDPNVRPIATKPMDDPQKSNGARKPRSKPTASDPVTPTKSAAGKRPAEEKETEAKDAKKSKKKPEPENSERKPTDDPKKSLFQRLWSEDDEIVILKGMIDYAAKKKADPVADLNAFHDFIKKNLHVDVTRTQLQDKIRRLKKKYENNKSKEKEGKERTFTKPHEQKAYELSKSIWGNENGKENGGEKVVGSPKANGSVARKAPSKRANVADNEDVNDVKSVAAVNVDSERVLPAKRVKPSGVTVEERILMIGTELFEDGKGLEGEKEWNKLRMDEMEAYLRNLEVKSAQTKLVMDTLKSVGN